MSRRQARRDVFLGRSTQEGNDSRNIGQGESWLQTRGECADWAAGRDLRQGEKLLSDKHGFPGGAVRMRHLARQLLQLLLATSIKGDGRSERRQRVLSLLQTHDADTTPRPLITARRTSHDSRHIFLLWLAESRLQTECSHNPILIILLYYHHSASPHQPKHYGDNYTPADHHLVQESKVEHCPTPW